MRLRHAPRFGFGVYAGLVERQIKFGSKVAAELKIGIGFCAAQPMMQMRGVQQQTKFPASFDKGAQQRNGIGAAREPHSKPHPGLQQGCIERE